ncbi:MAG: hypothetical protein LBU11_02420 [Zoogloeaceae bacterium]|nr:hypothetical protein [Zoogloeaceae bacterium]
MLYLASERRFFWNDRSFWVNGCEGNLPETSERFREHLDWLEKFGNVPEE